MLDKIYIFFLGLFIGISFLLLGRTLYNIENKIDISILELRVLERVQVLEELNFTNEEILKNVNNKYQITNEELNSFLTKGVE